MPLSASDELLTHGPISLSGGATEYLEFLNGERVLSVGQIVALLSDAMLTVLRDVGLTEVSVTGAGTTRTVYSANQPSSDEPGPIYKEMVKKPALPEHTHFDFSSDDEESESVGRW